MDDSVNEWMNEWMNEWVNDWVTEWVNDWVNEWVNERMSEWMNEWVSEWLSERMSERVTIWSGGKIEPAIPEQWSKECRKSRSSPKTGNDRKTLGENSPFTLAIPHKGHTTQQNGAHRSPGPPPEKSNCVQHPP